MRSDLVKRIWNLESEKTAHSKDAWIKIIQDIVLDFENYIQQSIQSYSDPYLNLKNPESPSFTVWIRSSDYDCREMSVANYAIFLAVIGGQMVGSMNENENDYFDISLTMFLFDRRTRKRLCLVTGESMIEFVLQRQKEESAKWINLGWQDDVYDEWLDVSFE